MNLLAKQEVEATHVRAENRDHRGINQRMGTADDPHTATVMAFVEPTKPLDGKRIVFVTGDEEYRSEESMPMLAEILHRDYGGDIRVCHAVSEEGIIDPNRLDHIEGLEAIPDADLVVLFTRFRALPDEQLEFIRNHASSGKPMVGFRTSTHAFRYPADSPNAVMNNEWPTEVFGQKWITHHGNHGDDETLLTDVTVVEDMRDHPVLRGVKPFKCCSWLYHVDGGGDALPERAQVLTMGRSLISHYEKNDRTDRFPLDQPVSWIMETDKLSNCVPSRVFFSTTAHPYDFRESSMRKHALNGILWAMGEEDLIPEDGADPTPVGKYDPRPAGFGNVYRPNMRPKSVGASKNDN